MSTQSPLSVFDQIRAGKLVCPVSRQPFIVDEEDACLVTADGRFRYPLLKGCVPVLVADPQAFGIDLTADPAAAEPVAPEPASRRSLLGGITRRIKKRVRAGYDFRNPASLEAVKTLFDNQPADALCLSVGGGPGRSHPRLVNPNIAPFANVEVVADAHALPYADGSVDAIFCEAVLEHLHTPATAVAEMHRVLHPGGQVFAATPFLQAYHGYPHHYQNFTLTGHTHLFEAQGFTIVESGACVGPIYALVTLMGEFLAQYYPSRFAIKLWNVIGLCLIPLNQRLNIRPNAHILASTTYLVAQKE